MVNSCSPRSRDCSASTSARKPESDVPNGTGFEDLDAVVAVLDRPGDDAAGTPRDEPGQRPPKLACAEHPRLSAYQRYPVGPLVGGVVVVNPVNEPVEGHAGAGGGGCAVGSAVGAGAAQYVEAFFLGGLQSRVRRRLFRPITRSPMSPALLLELPHLEGTACDGAHVNVAVGIAFAADASPLQMLDYWWRGDTPALHYSPSSPLARPTNLGVVCPRILTGAACRFRAALCMNFGGLGRWCRPGAFQRPRIGVDGFAGHSGVASDGVDVDRGARASKVPDRFW